ncbi:MAG: hypothetical protein LAT84_09080 [Balneolia bacterium]|nr:hypothetical protein [Balneolia bacterium]
MKNMKKDITVIIGVAVVFILLNEFTTIGFISWISYLIFLGGYFLGRSIDRWWGLMRFLKG